MSDSDNTNWFNKLADYFIKAFIVILIGIVFFRAYIISITYDEAFTYLHYVTSSVSDIISYKEVSANNHLLNTLLTKITNSIFGSSELSLRLPNVVAFVFFSLLFYKWLKQNTKNIALRIFGITLLLLNPFLFDFFSLSRGYGLSSLFVLLSLIEMNRIYNRNPSCSPPRLFLWLILAVLSNFSTLIFYLSVTIVFLLINIQRHPNLWRKYGRAPLFSFILLTATIYEPIRKLFSGNQFYFGGNTGFYEDTFLSLYSKFVETAIYPEFFPLLILSILITLGIISLLQWSSKGFNLGLSGSFITLIILLIAILISVSMHWIIGSKYLIYRTALFFYVIMSFFVVSTLIELQNIRVIRQALIVITLFWSGFMIFHFVTTFHFWYTYEWQYDASSKDVTMKLDKIGNEIERPLTIGASGLYVPSFNYYIQTRNLKWIKPMKDGGFKIGADYYYAADWETNDSILLGMKEIEYYQRSKTHLYINAELKND